jgi:hypothetical protein
MKPNIYAILTRAIDEGITRGVNRAYKHTDNPDRDTIMTAVYDAVIGDICEVFEFEGPPGEPQETATYWRARAEGFEAMVNLLEMSDGATRRAAKRPDSDARYIDLDDIELD